MENKILVDKDILIAVINKAFIQGALSMNGTRCLDSDEALEVIEKDKLATCEEIIKQVMAR